MALQPFDASVKFHLDSYLHAIEEAVSADVVAFVGPIVPGLDHRMRDAIEAFGERKKSVYHDGLFSCLGPIDPQIKKDDKLVPALSYLNQFQRLNKKAEDGELTSAEYVLLSRIARNESRTC